MLAWTQLFFSAIAIGQERSISGYVLDAEKGDAVIGATIKIKDKKVTDVSDSRGAFTIKAMKGVVLVFSSVGYKPAQLTVGDANELQVRLVPTSTQLNEVVVVGYGEQKQPTVTGAVGTISGKDLYGY